MLSTQMPNHNVALDDKWPKLDKHTTVSINLKSILTLVALRHSILYPMWKGTTALMKIRTFRYNTIQMQLKIGLWEASLKTLILVTSPP